MGRALSDRPQPARGGPAGREIGPLGTGSRTVGGLLFVAIPIAIHGIGWWDAAAALLGLPLLAWAVAAGLEAVWRRYRPGSRRAAAYLALALVSGLPTAVTFVSPIDGVAIWGFFGVSMLLAALQGYGGCEALAIPHLVSPRRSRMPCVLYAPIDAAERRFGLLRR